MITSQSAGQISRTSARFNHIGVLKTTSSQKSETCLNSNYHDTIYQPQEISHTLAVYDLTKLAEFPQSQPSLESTLNLAMKNPIVSSGPDGSNLCTSFSSPGLSHSLQSSSATGHIKFITLHQIHRRSIYIKENIPECMHTKI